MRNLTIFLLIVTITFANHVNVIVVDVDRRVNLYVEYLTLNFGKSRNVIKYRVGDDKPIPVPLRHLKKAESVIVELKDGGIVIQEIGLYYGLIDERHDMVLYYKIPESEAPRRWWTFVNELGVSNWSFNRTE